MARGRLANKFPERSTETRPGSADDGRHVSTFVLVTLVVKQVTCRRPERSAETRPGSAEDRSSGRHVSTFVLVTLVVKQVICR